MTPRVLVLGAGLAGLSAGYELAKRGLSVKVLDAAPQAGGRTTAFTDARGRHVDTGLHVVADHYLNLIELLSELGVSKHLRWIEQHTYLRAGRPPMAWYFSRARPPLHLVRPFREMPLGVADRMKLLRVGLSLSSYEQRDLSSLDHLSYWEWHRRAGLSDGFALELAEAAADAATFLTVREAAARPVLSWLKYLLRHRRAGDVGLFTGSLEDCMIRPLREAIERLGGEVRTRLAVCGVETEGQLVSAVRVQRSLERAYCCQADGLVSAEPGAEYWAADYFVSALPVQALGPALGREFIERAGAAGALGLGTTPAISAMLWFDRKVEPAPSGAPLVTGCAMRDFVDLATVGRQPAGAPGSVYQFVVTRAAERMGDSDAEIARDLERDLKQVWPWARHATCIDYSIERIGAAMFAARPGAHALRPETRTRFPNFVLAGDYVRHDLNASMEGAVWSGRAAANVILERAGLTPILLREAPDPSVVPMLRRIAGPWRRFGAGTGA